MRVHSVQHVSVPAPFHDRYKLQRKFQIFWVIIRNMNFKNAIDFQGKKHDILFQFIFYD